jgi:hypothetical protein
MLTYLRSWIHVAPIIASRFLLDSCPFLLEAIGVSSLGSLSFHLLYDEKWGVTYAFNETMCKSTGECEGLIACTPVCMYTLSIA